MLYIYTFWYEFKVNSQSSYHNSIGVSICTNISFVGDNSQLFGSTWKVGLMLLEAFDDVTLVWLESTVMDMRMHVF